MTLHLSQIFFTEARTFIGLFLVTSFLQPSPMQTALEMAFFPGLAALFRKHANTRPLHGSFAGLRELFRYL